MLELCEFIIQTVLGSHYLQSMRVRGYPVWLFKHLQKFVLKKGN